MQHEALSACKESLVLSFSHIILMWRMELSNVFVNTCNCTKFLKFKRAKFSSFLSLQLSYVAIMMSGKQCRELLKICACINLKK